MKVGPLTVEALAKSCLKLRYVNLSFTAATASSLQTLTSSLSNLEVLKIAGLQNLVSMPYTPFVSFIDPRHLQDGFNFLQNSVYSSEQRGTRENIILAAAEVTENPS